MIVLDIPSKYIAVLKLFAAEKDVRYWLNGICLEIGPEESRLIATNGHRLGCFRLKSSQPTITIPLMEVIIPSDMLSEVKPRESKVSVEIGDLLSPKDDAEESLARNVTLRQDGILLAAGKTADRKFPTYRKAIPTQVSGQLAQYDARYLKDLSKIWSLLHGSAKACGAAIGYNGELPALIDMKHDDFTGCILPLRVLAINNFPPWLFDSLEVSDLV